jgi:hypothetical protein
MKKVRVRLSGEIRAAVGLPEVLVQIPLDGTLGDLRRHLQDAFPAAAPLLAALPAERDGETAPPLVDLPPATDRGSPAPPSRST